MSIRSWLARHILGVPVSITRRKSIIVDVIMSRPDGEIYNRVNAEVQLGTAIHLQNQSGHNTFITVWAPGGKGEFNEVDIDGTINVEVAGELRSEGSGI